jgi:hypothetical protein
VIHAGRYLEGDLTGSVTIGGDMYGAIIASGTLRDQNHDLGTGHIRIGGVFGTEDAAGQIFVGRP